MLKKRQRDENEEVTVNEDQQVNGHKKKTVEQVEDDFSAFGIASEIADKLKEKSIVSLFEVQKKVYKPIYDGENVIAASLTGSGKTLSFVLPLLQKFKDEGVLKNKRPVCMVIAPTRELSI